MYKNKKEIEEAVACLKEEMRWQQYLKEWEKENFIQWEDYFTYSGETEEYKELVVRWRYDENNLCNILHERFMNKKKLQNEAKKIKKNAN